MPLSPSESAIVERRRLRYMLAEAGPGGDPGAGSAGGGSAGGGSGGGGSAGGGSGGSTRIAVLATPRSGNTWLRSLLAGTLELAELPVHHPADLDWGDLPERVVVQLHWPATPHLVGLLASAGVRVVTITRDPLDVLVSILRFAQTEPNTAEWLWGEGGDEESLVAAGPADEGFLRWATSPRAAAVLAVSRSWAATPGVVTLAYERLVDSPAPVLAELLEGWGVEPRRTLDEVVAANTPAVLNERGGLIHAWTATSGMGLRLLPTTVARELISRHGGPAGAEPAGPVSPAEAERRWRELNPDPHAVLATSAYRASISPVDLPATAAPGAVVSCLVKVHNLGTARWPDRARVPLIRVGCRWSRVGEEAVVLEDRQALDVELRPGALHYQPAIFRTPPAPGAYRLAVDLVHEGARWFGCGRSWRVNLD